jgi:opacity protein-like surface antigen
MKVAIFKGDYKINESIDISYKGGYEISPKTYATGRLGYGWVKVDHSITGSFEIDDFKEDFSVGYILAGLGIEHMLSSNLAITGEYQYRHSTEDMKHREMYTDGSGNYFDTKGDFVDHSFMIGFNYFF